MVQFCGQDRCTVDANGRVKLCPRFLADFRRHGSDVVMHCLPEGALGVYPVSLWLQMRQAEPRPATRASQSIVFRRSLRRFGALTQVEQISNQGRVTVPASFRSLVGLPPGGEAVLVGTEIGVEIWSAEAWQREFQLLAEHEQLKAEAEMAADLTEGGPAAPLGA